MNIYIIIAIVASTVLLLMAIAVLLGRGDRLISGYNTAKPEERARYNLPRLRALTGGFLLVILLLMWLSHLLGLSDGVTAAIVIALAVVEFVLQYTWARR